ncbi:MAG: DnaJ domain-containing protein [Hyphomicrobiales bacterium]|nr:DnaJ domain-containing protein [Hyphomicrobiales bacterium]
MLYFLLGLVAFALVYFAANAFVNANPAMVADQVRRGIGIALLGAAILLALTGRWVFALPLAGFALSFLGPRTTPRTGTPGTSRVRSAMLEMTLDHATGAMTGQVIAGQFKHRMLDDLDDEERLDLWRETVSDGDSRALLEAYLDRTMPGWRDDIEEDVDFGAGAAPRAGPMSKQQAYEILGLSPGAGEAEIRAAHKRLMKRLHPDQGGSTFLAAQINQAKDTLIGKHG